MKRIVIYSLIVLFFCCDRENNNQKGEFIINGTIEFDVDSIGIYPGFIKKDFLDGSFNFQNNVDNGSFKIKGSIAHPFMFNFISRKTGISRPFFIEQGKTDLNISFLNNDRDVHISEITKSSTQKEYEKLKSKNLDSLKTLRFQSKSREERKKINELIDLALKKHLKDNPDSYVALWLIADRFCINNSKYKGVYEESLNYFSDKIKNTHLFKKFKESLLESKNKTFEGETLFVKNIDLKEQILKVSELNNKYTLIDFWHSRCAPCLVEMPKYIPIYNKYKDLGFEIISISTDKMNDIKNWKRIIKEKEFNWVHYLDENKVEARKLNIISYPTTFLIDQSGMIIQKNISSEQLNNFLEQKLGNKN